MSLATDLHWTTATKAKPGKATEHSGAKKGKGAWDRKKTAKKSSNKARRASDKKESTTIGDDSDLPFPGAAPLFTKASELNWTSAEPRPCYPDEEPVEDHCNPNIAPPAPGGGDDMGAPPEHRDPDTQEWLDEQGADNPGWDEDDDDFLELGEDPMETAPPVEESPVEEAPQAPGLPANDPHGPRDPSLAPDAPHQFWAQEQPHIQDALNKYLLPQLNSEKPGVAEKARRILMEGPHVE